MTFELALPIIIHGGQKWNSSKKTSGIQKRTLTYKSVYNLVVIPSGLTSWVVLCLFSRSLVPTAREDISLMSWRNFVTHNFFASFPFADAKPFDCVWGPWTAWTACSVSCGGGGTQSRKRGIATPPSRDGAPCSAEDAKQTILCSRVEKCPIEPTTTEGKAPSFQAQAWPFFIGKTGSWDVSIGDFY